MVGGNIHLNHVDYKLLIKELMRMLSSQLKATARTIHTSMSIQQANS